MLELIDEIAKQYERKDGSYNQFRTYYALERPVEFSLNLEIATLLQDNDFAYDITEVNDDTLFVSWYDDEDEEVHHKIFKYFN